MKIKSPKNLIAVGVLAISLLCAHNAFAYVPGIWDPAPRVETNESAFTVVPSTYDAPVVPQVAQVQQTSYVSYVPAQPKVTYVAAQPVTTNRVVYTSAPTTNRVVYTTAPAQSSNVVYTQVPVQSGNLPPVVSGYQDQNNTDGAGFTSDAGNNNLAALSLGGSGGFLPSSIWQWLLLVALILVVIIIARSFQKPQAHHVAVH